MKDKIVEVALERFMQHGIRSMTIKKLVEPLGISTKTVYKYFNSKEELLAECLKVMYSHFYNEFSVLLRGDENPVVTLLTLFRGTFGKDFGMSRTFFHDLNYYYPELQNAAIGNGKEKFIDMLVPIVKNGMKGGYFKEDLNPAIALTGIQVVYTSITRSDSYKQFKVSPAVLFNNLVEVFLRGMCTAKGLKLIDTMQPIR